MSQFRLSNVTVRYMCMVTLLESKEGKGLKLSSYFFHIYTCVCVHMHVVKAEMMTGTPTASATIKVKGQKQVTVLSFNYLGSSVSSDGLKSEVLSTVVQATRLTKPEPIWNGNISIRARIGQIFSLEILYTGETCILTVDTSIVFCLGHWRNPAGRLNRNILMIIMISVQRRIILTRCMTIDVLQKSKEAAYFQEIKSRAQLH